MVTRQHYLILIKCKLNQFKQVVGGVYIKLPCVMQDLSLNRSIQMGFCRDQLQVSAIKYCFINYWKSKCKSSANKIYGWHKVCQNIENRAAKLINLDFLNWKDASKSWLQMSEFLPVESYMRSCVGWSCSTMSHSLPPWHAYLSEQNDMLALLLESEYPFPGWYDNLRWISLVTQFFSDCV